MMNLEDLIQELKTIPNWRRHWKVEHPLWLMILTSLIGAMSGDSSLRGMTDFAQQHYQTIAIELEQAVKRAPSYSTVRRMMGEVSGTAVARVFHQWVTPALSVPAGSGVALDGKALASTAEDCHGVHQDYVSIVSACVHETGWVVGQTAFQNGKESEIQQVRQLVQQLKVKGAWLTLDALHCQKNGGDDCRQ
jgi:hypothetical protein